MQQKELMEQLQLLEAKQQKEKLQKELEGVKEGNNRLNMKAPPGPGCLYWVIKNHPVEGIHTERSFSDRARSL